MRRIDRGEGALIVEPALHRPYRLVEDLGANLERKAGIAVVGLDPVSGRRVEPREVSNPDLVDGPEKVGLHASYGRPSDEDHGAVPLADGAKSAGLFRRAELLRHRWAISDLRRGQVRERALDHPHREPVAAVPVAERPLRGALRESGGQRERADCRDARESRDDGRGPLHFPEPHGGGMKARKRVRVTPRPCAPPRGRGSMRQWIGDGPSDSRCSRSRSAAGPLRLRSTRAA